MTNRPYLSMIQQSVAHDGITFEEITPDYLYKVKKGEKTFLMNDLEMGLNTSSSAKLAASKSGTYDVLAFRDIKAIEHVFLLNKHSRFQTSDPFQQAEDLFFKFNENVVIKPDNGAQGNNVFKIDNLEKLKETLDYLFSLHVSVAISPFYASTFEYRVITLYGTPKLFLKKERTNSWKHNLINGALSKHMEKERMPFLGEIAGRTSHALELNYCSVDILDTSHGLFVLEVNDQVMLENYLRDNPEEKESISGIYREAIHKRFETL
ncbi:RimK family alpha-L-glutamate ligase [Alteribacillus sp. YIM 98480]|uniref:ATP-grasp domain-containing protein n=1 Tax=Alteribacillus sp. YIM 98480 TaxID=2606599 RepID=UPI00131CE125|nr:hypothetical protein [Alteribacillus sp. YIM 98480]